MDDVEGDAVKVSRLAALCSWCVLAVGVEVALYVLYFAHEARFHWFTHFFVGASCALLVMTVVAWRTRCPVPYPLLWPILGHIVAMFPDFLFEAGIAHHRWMDVFLGHLSTHFIPGRNWTWYAIFLICLALYFSVISHASAAVASTRRLTLSLEVPVPGDIETQVDVPSRKER